MLNDFQKKALRRMIVSSTVSFDKMEAIGNDDNLAIAELAKFKETRVAQLSMEEDRLNADINNYNIMLEGVLKEKEIWNNV